jgi:hypothetical protein
MKKTNKKSVSACVLKKDAEEFRKLPKDLGQIILKEIRDVDMCEMVMETDDKTAKLVADIGRKLIKKDTEALFGYAVRKAIEDIVKENGRLGRK